MENKIKLEYQILLQSGMFWEFFPSFSGNWEDDEKEFTEFYNGIKNKGYKENCQGNILKLAKSLNLPYSEISDGYHTFKELYNFRMIYNAALFNEWANDTFMLKGRRKDSIGVKYGVHKSWKHHDGEWCFGKEKELFIVVAMLPTGQISNHYKAEYWDLFKIPETEKALFPFDGHTSTDVLERLKSL